MIPLRELTNLAHRHRRSLSNLYCLVLAGMLAWAFAPLVGLGQDAGLATLHGQLLPTVTGDPMVWRAGFVTLVAGSALVLLDRREVRDVTWPTGDRPLHCVAMVTIYMGMLIAAVVEGTQNVGQAAAHLWAWLTLTAISPQGIAQPSWETYATLGWINWCSFLVLGLLPMVISLWLGRKATMYAWLAGTIAALMVTAALVIAIQGASLLILSYTVDLSPLKQPPIHSALVLSTIVLLWSAGVGLALLNWRATYYRRLRRCASCGYDLRHSTRTACPECGEPHDLQATD